jgi:(E)-4-hydroxy-3-methylbut-2-enyl-diphosphate synthase
MKRVSRAVKIRDMQIGGGAPVSVQSMTKTDTTDVAGTLRQIEQMVEAGCEIVRIAVPDDDAAAALKDIRKGISITNLLSKRSMQASTSFGSIPATSAISIVFAK